MLPWEKNLTLGVQLNLEVRERCIWERKCKTIEQDACLENKMVFTSGKRATFSQVHTFFSVLFFFLFKKKKNWSKLMTLSQVQRVLDTYLFIHVEGRVKCELSEPSMKPVACNLRNGHYLL